MVLHELARCYRVLGLEPGPPFDEVKSAYRDLVNVWHPDRFGHNERLRSKAERHLKEINLEQGNRRLLRGQQTMKLLGGRLWSSSFRRMKWDALFG